MGVFEREFFLEFWKTLRCLWFCGTKTYHKVLALSCPRSRSDLIGESEPVSGCETIYWDSFFYLFIFLFIFFFLKLN